MARRGQKVADTQLAFDLFGLFEEVESEQQHEPRTVTGQVAGDGELFGADWANQQRPDVTPRHRGEGINDSDLARRISDQPGGLNQGTERLQDGTVSAPVGVPDSGSRDDGAGLQGSSGGTERGAGRRPGLDSGQSRDTDGGAGGRRATLRFTRGGIVPEPVGDEAVSDLPADTGTATDVPTNDHADASTPVPLTGGRGGRVDRGLAAVITLQRLLHTGSTPSSEELAALAQFPGWGATQELFDPNSKKYADERAQFQELWSDHEWAAARRTVLNAHYTDPQYVSAVWEAFDRLGVPVGSKILEPGCGTGNFITQARPGDHMVGVELDPTTAKIAGLLNPDAQVINESFAETRLEGDGFDAAIGNVPFSDVVPFDPAYNRAGLSMHNAFMVKSLRMTKPGGIVALMTSRWTMDGKRAKARTELAKYGAC